MENYFDIVKTKTDTVLELIGVSNDALTTLLDLKYYWLCNVFFPRILHFSLGYEYCILTVSNEFFIDTYYPQIKITLLIRGK